MTKKKNTREESTKKYVDALQDINSKLCSVRVDLSYSKPHSENITLEEANKDLNRLLNNRRSKRSIFEHNVGYIFKREYTEDKGVHIHGILFFDGQKVQKDAFIGDEICKYWKDDITKGKGSYHNCNRNKYERHGIGMLDHKDKVKRKILDKDVLSYLCKDEQDITPIKKSKKDRAFTRGTIPNSKGKSGRPRKSTKDS